MEAACKCRCKPGAVGKMISGQELRKIARERGLRLDLIEKDYALGWTLFGVSRCSISSNLVFKGGTALSKVYFPFGWRISEDLDFTLIGDLSLEEAAKKLVDELPVNVNRNSNGIQLTFKPKPFLNPDYIQIRAQFTGPVSSNTVKIEVTKENFVGDYNSTAVPTRYDYTPFSVLTYTLDNILAEKLRAIIERTRIRDYYDSWKLLNLKVVDAGRLRELFTKKCEGKGIIFRSVEQFFPEDLDGILRPHLNDLTRLTSEPLPPLEEMLGELRNDLKTILINP
jgi:predicted nucleotidyltransferase component of viral defense system